VIALGLAIELIAAGVLIVGLLLGESQASATLWSAIAIAFVGLAVASIGVLRARPPRRPVVPVSPPVPDSNGQQG
jgi:O-antigen/teichoic acid export membrane protein